MMWMMVNDEDDYNGWKGMRGSEGRFTDISLQLFFCMNQMNGLLLSQRLANSQQEQMAVF